MICDTEIWIMYLFKFIYILLWFYVCHTWEGLPWHKMTYKKNSSSVQSLSHVRLFATPWTAALQASLSLTNSWSLFKLRSIELVMPSNHLILVVSLFSHLQSFPASGLFPVSQFFTSGGQNIGASVSASDLPMNIQDWFPLISLQSKGLSRVLSNTTVQKYRFFSAQLSL